MGYKWEGMKKISYEEAVKRHNNNLEVYLLYDDDTESAVEDNYGDRMKDHHKRGGEFGYEIEHS